MFYISLSRPPLRSLALYAGSLLMLLAAGCGTARYTPPGTVPEQERPGPDSTKQRAPRPVPFDSSSLIDPTQIPETPREMRAVWIASVANIDWPSAPGLPVSRQKAELINLLDRAAELHINAVFLQVRPSADALYDSPYEPWSEFLTGQQGQPPEPYYDPLAFAVEQAHRRGLELHAWFNPFRARHHAAESDFAPGHIKNRKPQLVVPYGRYHWMDPGWPEARRHSLEVILDVARRYDVDGIHLDDYFYPYAEPGRDGQDMPFPDEDSYRHYLAHHPPLPKDDWRRQNINQFIQSLSAALQELKPGLLFGISPFGIWRPGHPPQIKGYDAYGRIYADSRKWLREGWVDYLTPQLYWAIDDKEQSYPVLLDWWNQQNFHDRHLWPGLYTSRVGTAWKTGEISRQIQIARRQKGSAGHVHYSMQALHNNNAQIGDSLVTGPYQQPALVPGSVWKSSSRPPQPRASLKEDGGRWVLELIDDPRNSPWLWVVKLKYGDTWTVHIQPGRQARRLIAEATSNGAFAGASVSAVNRDGRESVPQLLLPPADQVLTSSTR